MCCCVAILPDQLPTLLLHVAVQNMFVANNGLQVSVSACTKFNNPQHSYKDKLSASLCTRPCMTRLDVAMMSAAQQP